MLSSLILVWYAAVAPAFGRLFGFIALSIFIVAGESYGIYSQGVFILIAGVLFMGTDVLKPLLRESGARALAMYAIGVVAIYVLGLTIAMSFAGTAIRPLLVVLWLSELIIAAGVIQSIAKPERILHARHETYAKVEEVFSI